MRLLASWIWQLCRLLGALVLLWAPWLYSSLAILFLLPLFNFRPPRFFFFHLVQLGLCTECSFIASGHCRRLSTCFYEYRNIPAKHFLHLTDSFFFVVFWENDITFLTIRAFWSLLSRSALASDWETPIVELSEFPSKTFLVESRRNSARSLEIY